MVNIEPYDFQKKTNIKEHNDMVDKINEIVNVINDAELEGIGSRLDTIDSTDALQWKSIESIKAKNVEQDDKIGDNTKVLADVIDSSVSDVAIMNGTTTGNIKVRIGRENAPSIDSDDYNIQKPTSVELVQGSAPAMVKAQITLSDGTVLISDDFMFTTESIGQDVYISSFVFKNGNVAGTISADIGLSNGTTLEANNFVVPTDPNVISSITDLQNRMTAVESADVGELATLKTTVAEHTVAITALDNDVTDIMLNKADVNNSSQNITVNSIIGKSLYAKTDDTSGYAVIINNVPNDENTPIRIISQIDSNGSPVGLTTGYVAMLDASGNPKNFTAGGSTVIECPLNYQDFFSSLQLGSEIYGDRLDFSNNDTDTIASFYNFNLKCVTNNDTDGIYIIGQAYKTQMVLGNNATLYRNSVAIVFKSGKVTITVEGGTNETASSSIIVKRSQFLPMSTINTNVFIRV